MLSRTPKLSVVLPVFNEIESLPAVVREIHETLGPLGFEYELLLVDDGSDDGSLEWMERAARDDERLVVVPLRQHIGQSAAFAAGFARARAEITVTLDADGQNPPAEIPKLLDRMREGADVVVGYRSQRRDGRWRRLQSRVANAVRNRLTGETIRDTGCSLKAMRSVYLRQVPQFQGMHRFLPTLCRMAGASRVVEVPVEHRPRAAGTSKYGMGNRALAALADLIAVRWMQWRWIRGEVGDDD